MVETNERALLEEKLKNREATLSGREVELAAIESELQAEMQEELAQ